MANTTVELDGIDLNKINRNIENSYGKIGTDGIRVMDENTWNHFYENTEPEPCPEESIELEPIHEFHSVEPEDIDIETGNSDRAILDTPDSRSNENFGLVEKSIKQWQNDLEKLANTAGLRDKKGFLLDGFEHNKIIQDIKNRMKKDNLPFYRAVRDCFKRAGVVANLDWLDQSVPKRELAKERVLKGVKHELSRRTAKTLGISEKSLEEVEKEYGE